MNKKHSLLLAILPLLLTSCGNKDANHTNSVKKVDYLYEISYDKYDWDTAKESLLKLPEGNLSGFGCSSARNGNFYGRSFDFTFNHMSEFVVRSTAGKYKNIGIGIANTETTPTMVENGLSVDQYNVLPYSVVDGINEKGVVCNANVVPVTDLTKAGGTRTTGTNPGKQDYFYQFLCRYILDNAASAQEAKDLILNDLNITNKLNNHVCDYYTLNKAGFELHYMIADKDDTFIIEFVNNEIKVLTDKKVMTNYYLSIDPTPHACGIERYNTLMSGLNGATSVEAMADLMERVRYTKLYETTNDDINTNVKWYTDLVSGDFLLDDIKGLFNNYPQEMIKILKAANGIITNNKRNGETATVTINIGEGDIEQSVDVPWQSVHMSVYDIEHKTLRLVTQEQYERVFNYSLD